MSPPSPSPIERRADAAVGVARLDGEGCVRLANRALVSLLGTDPVGLELVELVVADERGALAEWLAARRQAGPGPGPVTAEHCLDLAERGICRVVLSAEPHPSPGGVELVVQVMAVGELMRAMRLHAAQRDVLELVASGAPLADVLAEVVRRAQELQPGMRGSVLLLSADRTCLEVGAAPDLPAFFRDAMHGLPAQVGMGCCGTTAATGVAQVAEDVRVHPFWEGYRELAERAGVRSCWSEPILSSRGDVLGTCAFFHHEPTRPSRADQEAIRGMSHLLAVAIERHATEAARERLADDLRTTLGALGDAVVAVDGEGRVGDLNARALELLGEAARGQALEAVLDLRERGGGQPVDPWSLSSGRGDLSRPVELLGAGGERRVISVGGTSLVRLPSEPPEQVLVLRDVTAEVDLAERLRHTSKMEAIGELAGGVAHDFNNLLTGILSNAELLRPSLGADDGRLVDQILVAADRAAQLTRQLLSFSRKGRLRTSPVDLHVLVAELIDLLRHSIDPRIRLDQQLQARQNVVLGDPGELHNALLNLCLNARDAMPAGGRLTLTTRSLELDERACATLASEVQLVPGPFVEITVRDTGSGMSREVAARVFEPYFTTKSPGEGTGLGLSSVYGCVHSHQGLIDVRSTPGQGSAFRVLLPAAASQAPTSAPAPRDLPRGSGHILLVDDESLVRVATRKLLEDLGYRVTTCQDGTEALDLLAAAPDAVDLVLLDMVMPRLDGLDTLRRLRRAGVDVPVLLCTGHTERGRAQAALDEGALGLLSKPYRQAELADLVARHCRPASDGAAGA